METMLMKSYWEEQGAQYSENWVSPARRMLSQKELSFLNAHVPSETGQSALDVGIGNGRILEELVAHDEVEAVHGIDLAERMVEVSRAKLAGSTKIRSLSVCDIAREPLPVPAGLQFISAIRVLKYTENWWEIVHAKLLPHLAPRGVLVFSMPNSHSYKRFSRGQFSSTTEEELRQRLQSLRADVLDVSGFSKVPDLFYRMSRQRPLPARWLDMLEEALTRALGPTTFASELLVAVRRPA
jgi:trans-aconitate methyltransferase